MRITKDITAVKQRARQAFDATGKSQDVIAATIDVRQSTLWNFLYGETKNFGKISEFCEAVGITLDWLLTGISGEPPSNYQENLDNLESALQTASDFIQRHSSNQKIDLRMAMLALSEATLQFRRAEQLGEALSREEISGIVKAFIRRNASAAS